MLRQEHKIRVRYSYVLRGWIAYSSHLPVAVGFGHDMVAAVMAYRYWNPGRV